MKRKRGYTLIELIATMSVTLAVLTLLATWLSAVMKNQTAAGEHLLTVNSQERLARQFREDVHAARQVLPLDVAAAGVQLRLDRGTFETQYACQGRFVERIEQVEGAVRRREVFRVQARSVQFATEGEPDGLVRLQFTETAIGKPRRDLVIEAMLGSDRRFERGAP